MKIDINTEKIEAEVTRQMVEYSKYAALDDVRQTVKGVISSEVKNEVRKHVREILEGMKTPEGEPFIKDHIYKLLHEPSDVPYNNRLKLKNLIEETVQSNAFNWWRSLAEPHLKEIKVRIEKDFVARLFGQYP